MDISTTLAHTVNFSLLALDQILNTVSLVLMLFVRRGEAPAGHPDQLPVGREANP